MLFVLHIKINRTEIKESKKKSYKMQMNNGAFPYCFHSLPLVTYCALWKAFNVQIFCLERCIMRDGVDCKCTYEEHCIMLVGQPRTAGNIALKSYLNFHISLAPSSGFWRLLVGKVILRFNRDASRCVHNLCDYFILSSFSSNFISAPIFGCV